MVLWNILFIDVFLNSLSQHTLGLQHHKIPYISHNEKLKMKKIYGNIDQWLTKLYPNKNICRNLPRNLFLYLLLYEPFETFKNSGMINCTYFWIRNLRFGIVILRTHEIEWTQFESEGWSENNVKDKIVKILCKVTKIHTFKYLSNQIQIEKCITIIISENTITV